MYFTVFADVPAYTLFVSCSNVKCQMKWDRSVPGMRYGKEGVQEGGGRSGCRCRCGCVVSGCVGVGVGGVGGCG